MSSDGCIISNNSSNNINNNSNNNTANMIIVRLFLIRHGETMANCAGLVVGQSDSPLTPHGQQQAQQLYQYALQQQQQQQQGHCSWWWWCMEQHQDDDEDHVASPTTTTNHGWWRIYISDLKRTMHTACLVLGLLTAEQEQKEEDKDPRNKHPTVFITFQSSPATLSSRLVVDPQLEQFQQLLRNYNNNNNNNDHSHLTNTTLPAVEDNTTPTTTTPLVVLEPRIREMSKGVCEGLPKNTLYQHALQLWKQQRQQQQHVGSHDTNPQVVEHDDDDDDDDNEQIQEEPLRETPDQGWNRVEDWMNQLVHDAVHEHHHHQQQLLSKTTTRRTELSSNDESIQGKSTTTSSTKTSTTTNTTIYPVLAIMHAGILRTTLMRLFPNHHVIQQQNGGMLEIPNMSITVVDLHHHHVGVDDNDDVDDGNTTANTFTTDSKSSITTCSNYSDSNNYNNAQQGLKNAKAHLVQWTWTGHLQSFTGSRNTSSHEVENAE